ncbi:MAG: MFS transporter [Vicinamibacterales bacterium]
MPSRLFTPRFFIMFGYSFTVFVSVFQLLPTAPYRVLDLGGSTAVAGLFHGFLTFSSAASAPFAGPLSDRLGHRRVLMWVSLMLAVFTASYAFISDYRLMLAVVVGHGLIWSALLSASGAYMTATIPASRRGEGLGYWGLSSVLAIGAAPALGFWVYRHGWAALCAELTVLNLLMAAIAWSLPDDDEAAREERASVEAAMASSSDGLRPVPHGVEWRVVWLSATTSLVTFGYGSLTSFSALFADQLGLSPRSLFLSVMACAVVVSRLTIGRTLDALGPRRVLVRSMWAPPLGLLLLALARGEAMFIASAIVFGAGFGLLLPAYNTYVLTHVHPYRRGAAFGGMLAAFDTGIGAGSSAMGALVHAHGFRVAYGFAALVAAMALPYFLFAERKFGFASEIVGNDPL